MALPGFLGSNIARNVDFGHTVRLFVKRTGTTEWLDLGDLDEVNITPTVEVFEHTSNHDGRTAIAKRIVQTKALSLGVVLNEVNIANLRFGLFAGAAQTGSINAIATETPKVTSSNTLVLSEVANTVISVRSEDGETTYALTTDYPLDSDGVTINIVSSSSLDTDTATDDKIHVTLDVAFGGAAPTRKIELLDVGIIEGVAQFQIRNSEGGLSQIMELDAVSITPNGDLGVPKDGIQSIPITIAANILNGQFGRVYLTDVAAA